MAEVGRNLSAELDEVKEKIEHMTKNHEKLKDIVLSIRDSLLVSRLRISEPGPLPSPTPLPLPTQVMTVPLGKSRHDYFHTAEPTPVPIGEGYQSMGNLSPLIQITSEPTWRSSRTHDSGTPVATLKANSNAFDEQDKRKGEWMEKMDEEIKAIKGISSHKLLKVQELCPTTDFVLPKDFKVPEFTKYDGSGNPQSHLINYATKMCVWSEEDNFLIGFFHESLIGPALEWYLQLNHPKISKWAELVGLFMEQYRFNIDRAPTREELGAMRKKKEESFKEYATRWRTVASQVRPVMRPTEMNSYFLGTLGPPFVGALAGVAFKDFTELTQAGERIEMLFYPNRSTVGEDEGGSSKASLQSRKNENEANYIRPGWKWGSQSPVQTFAYPISNIPDPQKLTETPNTNPLHHIIRIAYANSYTYQTNSQTLPIHSQSPNTISIQNPNRAYSNLPPFPRFGISNAELFQQLMDCHLITPFPVRPMESNFPSWYNANLTCKYHMDVPGHSIEDCEQFKIAVRGLIACGKLVPNIEQNPIPDHEVNAINVKEIPSEKTLGIRVPMQYLFNELKKAGHHIMAPKDSVKESELCDLGSYCDYHQCANHDIENCWGFKVRVQGLLTLGILRGHQNKTLSQQINDIDKVVEEDSYKRDAPAQDVDRVMAQRMASKSYQKGKGLDLRPQGTQYFLTVLENLDKFGLGYEATLGERMMCLTVNEKGGQELKKFIPHTKETFPSPAEIISPNVPHCHYNNFSINALKNEA